VLSGGFEGVDDICGLGDRKGSCGDDEAGVVVNEVEDLDVAPGPECPVGDVALPALVGSAVEADQRRLRAFLGFGGDEPSPCEDLPDRRDRGTVVTAFGEVPVNGPRAGVETGIDKFLTQPDDRVFDVVGCAVGSRVRTPGLALRSRHRGSGRVAPTPTSSTPHGPGDLPDSSTLEDHRIHHVASQCHPTTHATECPGSSATCRPL
jgi:hypothetical protein